MAAPRSSSDGRKRPISSSEPEIDIMSTVHATKRPKPPADDNHWTLARIKTVCAEKNHDMIWGLDLGLRLRHEHVYALMALLQFPEQYLDSSNSDLMQRYATVVDSCMSLLAVVGSKVANKPLEVVKEPVASPRPLVVRPPAAKLDPAHMIHIMSIKLKPIVWKQEDNMRLDGEHISALAMILAQPQNHLQKHVDVTAYNAYKHAIVSIRSLMDYLTGTGDPTSDRSD
jgi:hypothetical protein